MRTIGSVVSSFLNRVPAPHPVQRNAWSGLLGNSTYGPFEAYGSNATLFPIVSGLAQDTATVDWCLHRTKNIRSRSACDVCGAEGVTNEPQHPAYKLWMQPNKFQPGPTFREASQQHIDLAGETFWMVEKEARANLPVALWLRWPHQMWEVPDEFEFLTRWLTSGPNGQKVPLELDEVLHTKLPNPANAYRGIGPVQSAMCQLGFQREALAFNNALLRNGVRPSGVIGIEGENDDDVRQLARQVREQHAGSTNAGRVMILNKNAKWQPMQYSNADMQFTDMFEMTNKALEKAFRYSEWNLGVMGNANRASSDNADKFYTSKLLVPRLNRIKGTLNHGLLPLYGSLGQGYEFSYHNPVPEDKELENSTKESSAKVFRTLVITGVSPEDASASSGMPVMNMSGPITADPSEEVTV